MKNTYILKSHYKMLTNNLNVSLSNKKEFEKELAISKAQGDLSENAEYDSALLNLTLVNQKLSRLQKLLSSCIITNNCPSCQGGYAKLFSRVGLVMKMKTDAGTLINERVLEELNSINNELINSGTSIYDLWLRKDYDTEIVRFYDLTNIQLPSLDKNVFPTISTSDEGNIAQYIINKKVGTTLDIPARNNEFPMTVELRYVLDFRDKRSYHFVNSKIVVEDLVI